MIELVKASGQFKISGILDSQLKAGIYTSEVAVLGKDDLLAELYDKGIRNACIGVGSIRDNSKRKMLYEKVKQIGFSVPSLIHPHSILSNDIKLSEGVR